MAPANKKISSNPFVFCLILKTMASFWLFMVGLWFGCLKLFLTSQFCIGIISATILKAKCNTKKATQWEKCHWLLSFATHLLLPCRHLWECVKCTFILLQPNLLLLFFYAWFLYCLSAANLPRIVLFVGWSSFSPHRMHKHTHLFAEYGTKDKVRRTPNSSRGLIAK